MDTSTSLDGEANRSQKMLSMADSRLRPARLIFFTQIADMAFIC